MLEIARCGLHGRLSISGQSREALGTSPIKKKVSLDLLENGICLHSISYFSSS